MLIRVLVKVFPVSTVEPAKRFMRLTTTDVCASKTLLVKTATTVSYFNISVNFSVIGLNLIRLITSKRKKKKKLKFPLLLMLSEK